MGLSKNLFNVAVNPSLTCSVCEDVFFDPVVLPDGCVFSQTCIQQSFKQNLKCPNDEEQFS